MAVNCDSAQRYHQLCSSLLILIDYNKNTKFDSFSISKLTLDLLKKKKKRNQAPHTVDIMKT